MRGDEMEISMWIAAIPSALIGFVVWFFKRTIDAKEKERAQQDKEREDLLIMMITANRETQHLCAAIARAVQRIPDAKCNGDMSSALSRAEEIRRKEKEFLIKHGVHHIFE